MINTLRNLLSALTLGALLVACSSGSNNSNSENLLLPPANGEVGELILAIDSSQFAGPLGKALRKTFNVPMEALPQDEMRFKLLDVSPLKLNNTLKRTKNLIYVTTLEDKSDESKVMRQLYTNESLQKINQDQSKYITLSKDVHARGQVVMYLYSKNGEILADHINKNQDYLRDIFESVERDRIKKKIFGSREKEIEKTIRGDHGYNMKVPFGYEIAKNLPNFTWVRFIENDYDMNFFVYYEDFTDQDQLKDMLGLRERITSSYLRDSEKEQLHITTQPILPMLTDTITFKNKFALKNKGLWKISDGSAGGPYVSYSFVDEKNSKLYYIEGYVFAPGRDKKNFVRELDAILSTFDTPSELAQASQK